MFGLFTADIYSNFIANTHPVWQSLACLPSQSLEHGLGLHRASGVTLNHLGCLCDLWDGMMTHRHTHICTPCSCPPFEGPSIINTGFIFTLHNRDDETLHIPHSSCPGLQDRLEDAVGNLSLSLIHSPTHAGIHTRHTDSHAQKRTHTISLNPMLVCMFCFFCFFGAWTRYCTFSCNLLTIHLHVRSRA